MASEKNMNKHEQAKLLANLTFKLEKICQEKESHFAKQFNLTAAEFRCLRYLMGKKYLSVKDLAAFMNTTSSRVTYLITSLEKKNLVTREIDKNDRRNIRVELTDSAKPFVEEIDSMYILFHEKIIEAMKPDNRDCILNSLGNMFSVMDNWANENIRG